MKLELTIHSLVWTFIQSTHIYGEDCIVDGAVPDSKEESKWKRGKETGKMQKYLIARLESLDLILSVLKLECCEHWAYSWTAPILSLLLPSCVTQGILLNYPVPQFLYL